ncbi:MAG: T9SS type A sorting domain-containing protein, partial [candidate division Zixibacteria bacterium]|nr:T9SS type A sorting domain-containing protein [candidate division Zixibacteria bacterium]
VETTESVYGVTSIALDGAGNPHIAFDKGYGTGEQLWHAWWDGSNWQQEGIDSQPDYSADVGEWNSIAFDTDGYPHIAYTYQTWAGDCYLRHAYKDASGWHIQVADSLIGDEFQYVSLALDNDNNPHISYYDCDVYDLKYAHWDGATWHTVRVDSTGGVGKHSSIALDSLDYPHIAYLDGTNYGVKYARWDGSNWQIETVESDVGYGFYTSLALDANDRPHISSGEYMGNLRFAYWDGSDWQIEVVDNTVCCDWTSLAIDDSGYCHIAYYDGGDSTNLKYAKRIPTTTGVEETADHSIPRVFSLAQNYPNPFNPTTSIQYVLLREGFVQLQIYNIAGQLVRTLVSRKERAGTHTVSWNGKDNDGKSVSSGIYFYRLETDRFKSAKKMLLLK